MRFVPRGCVSDDNDQGVNNDNDDDEDEDVHDSYDEDEDEDFNDDNCIPQTPQ